MTQKSRKAGPTALQIATFTQKWLPLLETLEHDLEALKAPSTDSDEDNGHLLQAEAVAKTQSTILAFESESKSLGVSASHYSLAYNPFTLIDGLKAFCFAFCDEWQTIKNEQWGGMPKHSTWLREVTSRINPILKTNAGMNPRRVREVGRKGKGKGRKKGKGKKEDGDFDGEYEE